MFLRLVCLSVAVLFISNVATADERLLGKWKLISVTYGGGEIPQNQVDGTQMEVRSDAKSKKLSAEISYQGVTMYSDVEFPPKSWFRLKPVVIKMTPRRSKDIPGDTTLTGLYKLSKNKKTLEMIFGREGQGPPKNFEALGLHYKYERIKE